MKRKNELKVFKESFESSLIVITRRAVQKSFDKFDDIAISHVEKQLRSYIEPTRKGTPKGERIGYGRNKFSALMLYVRGLTTKQIAEELSISYPVARKWASEEEFKARVQHHRNTIIGEWYEVRDRLLAKACEEIAREVSKKGGMTAWH